MNDSADAFSLYACCAKSENDDDDDNIENAKIDRGDDSMNDLSEVDRRDFFRKDDFIDDSHLLNC